jgi:hypothetical protein
MARPPKTPGQPKARQISIRFDQALLGRLKDSAAREGRTLSEEISRRLDRSFLGEAAAVETFGGDHTYAFLKLVAQAFKQLRSDTGQCWHRDRFTFDHAVKAVAEIFPYFRPQGRPTMPSDMPILERFKEGGIAITAELKKRLRAYAFGRNSGATAVFRMEVAPPEGQEAAPHQRIFQRIAFELRSQLSASGRSAQRDLIELAKEG